MTTTALCLLFVFCASNIPPNKPVIVVTHTYTHTGDSIRSFLMVSAVTAAIQSPFAETSSVCEVYSK